MSKFTNFRKSKLWLFMLLTMIVGASPVWADAYTEGFEKNVNGWKYANENLTIGAGWSYSGSLSDYALSTSYHKSGSTGLYNPNSNTENYIITPKLAAGIISFYGKAKSGATGNTVYVNVYKCTDNGNGTFTIDTSINLSSHSNNSYNGNLKSGDFNSYSFELNEDSHLAFLLSKACIDDFSAPNGLASEAVDGPALTVKDGSTSIQSPYAYNFGLATAGTTHVFTLTNPGTAAVEGLSVSETGNFGATLSATTIAAGGEATLTVTMPEATGSSEITISSTTEGVVDFVINVSGTIRDANKLYEYGFSALPTDWTTTGSWYYSEANGAYTTSWYLSSNVRLITPKLTIAEGENFFVEAKGYSTSNTSYQHLQMQYSADGTTWTNFDNEPTLDPSNWNTFAFTGVPAGRYYIAINASQADIRMFYGGQLPVEPKMVVTQPASLDFGVISESTTKTFTIANRGKATLEGINVSSSNSIFTVTGAPTSLGAGESAEVTITMAATTTGALSSDITVSAAAMEDVKFTVSGAVLPTNADVVDFNTAIPNTWDNQSNGWSISDGAAKCTGKYNLTSPKLDFSADDAPFFVFKVKASDGGSGDWVTLEGSSDNGATWTAFDKKTYAYNNDFGAVTADYSTIVVNIPNTVNKLRFNGYYVLIDEIVGLKYSASDPKMGVYTDADCTVAVATSVTKEFGFLAEAPEAVTYYIKNDGTGTMNLSKTDAAGFTVTLDKTAVVAGEKAVLTINFDSNKGYHGGNVVVTAEGLGNFTVALSGVVVDENKINLDFTTDNIPTTWTANDWSKEKDYSQVENPYIEVGYTSSILQTSTLTAKANETLVVVAKQSSSSNSYTFGVKYRQVGTETWNDLIPSANIGTDYVMLHGTVAEAGSYELQFIGNYTQIKRIYGFEKPNVPEMVVYDGDVVAADSYSFGKVTDEAVATHVFTVKNEGKADMTGLTAELSGDNAEDYEVAVSAEEGNVAAGGSATVTVTQKAVVGTHTATLTISADGLESKVIALSGKTVDHTVLDVDFDASGEWPAEILAYDLWTIYNHKGSGEARQASSDNATSLLLTPVTVAAATDKLNFQVCSYQTYSSRDLTVRYTIDGGVTWTEYGFNTEEGQDPVISLKEQITSSYKNFEITNIPAGTVAFDFCGKSIKIDNITGDYKPTKAPIISLTEDGKAVEDKDFGNMKADKTITYTLKNIGNDVLKATLKGEGVTVSAASVELAAGKSTEITVTMAFAAPYGEKTGNMTITSEGWVGDIVVNYTAEAIDPTNLVVDFENNTKPEGWYSENWTYAKGVANIYGGTAKRMITEKIGAENGKNTLTFDAKIYAGEDEQTLNVYTSADRKNWSEPQTFTLTTESKSFNLEPLADGEYYVKFEARNAQVDNIKGVKKLEAPAHDLFVSATTLPTEPLFVDTKVTVTATVVNLRADETGVYAKLFVDGKEVATSDDADIATDGTKTFSMPYTATVGAHLAYIEVYYNDNTVAFTTLPTEFEVKNYPELVLDESSTEALSFTTGTYDVTLKRSFAEGWSTICLPFEVEVTDIHAEAVAYSFTSYNTETKELNFQKVTTLSAATPYVIFVPEAIKELKFLKKALNEYYVNAHVVNSNGAKFQGTYAPIAASGMEGKYGVTGAGKIAKGGANASMKGFRAYFELPADGGNARLAFYDEATGITRVMNANELNNDAYNLKGQRVESLKKGNLYIVGGKKVMVK